MQKASEIARLDYEMTKAIIGEGATQAHSGGQVSGTSRQNFRTQNRTFS